MFLIFADRANTKPTTNNNTTTATTNAPPTSVWGQPSQTSTEQLAIPKPTSDPLTPTSTESPTVPKPVSGPPTQTSSGASTIPKPVWGSPSQTSSPAPRSSSAFPTLNESIRRLSVDTTSTSTKEPRSHSVRQGNRRRFVCSAVPDTALFAPLPRPDDGGSKGQPITVYTNHFPVTMDDALVNQYDIDIVMIGRDGKERSARKDDRWNMIQSLVNDKKKNFPFVW